MVLLLSACAEPLPIADKQPGVYKGAQDPLTSASSDDRAKILSDRLKLIQARE